MKTKGYESVAVVTPVMCLRFAGVLYVPSYNDEETFVGPGGKTVTRSSLTSAGAQPVISNLWPRNWASKKQFNAASK